MCAHFSLRDVHLPTGRLRQRVAPVISQKETPPPLPSAPVWLPRGPFPKRRARTAACSTEDDLPLLSSVALPWDPGKFSRRAMRFPDAERTFDQITDPIPVRSLALDFLGVSHLP